jgi:hypothetical protein
MVANSVSVDDPRIRRRPACELRDDTDLGALPVTVDVPALGDTAVRRALQAGAERARDLQASGLMESAVLVCQGWFTTCDGSLQRLQGATLAGSAGELLLA